MEKKPKIDRFEQFNIFNALPRELSILIFSFLPVRSLLVLRSVCKWLLSFIDHPEFVKFHLHHFPSNVFQNRFLHTDTVELINVQRDRYRGTGSSSKFEEPYYAASLISSSNVEEFTDYVYPTLVEGERTHSLWVDCYIDGLLLLTTTIRDMIILLWNPSMRKYRWISLPNGSIDYISLGYDRASNDYKVLAMCSPDELEAYVYSVKKGSWTSLALDKHKVEDKFGSYEDPFPTSDGVVLLAMDDKLHMSSTLLFDWRTETFHYGNQELIDMKRTRLTLSRFGLVKLDGGSTAGMWGYDVDDNMCIWALEICTMSWRKRFKVSREMMPRSMDTFSYIERNGELVWKYKSKHFIEELTYDIKTHMIKRHIKKPYVRYFRTVFIESMIIP